MIRAWVRGAVALALLFVPALAFAADRVTVATVAGKPTPATNVNVVNTPNVNVLSSPAVNVGNTSDNPVPVAIVDGNAAAVTREPFQFMASKVNQTADVGYLTFAVPADKRLVIENVSMSARLQLTQAVWEFSIETLLTEQPGVAHVVPVFKQAESTTQAFFSAGQQVRLYADGGTTVFLRIYLTNADPANYYNFFASVSGYLIPITSPSLGPGL